MATKIIRTAVPKSMQVQLGRLFGAESCEARQTARTARNGRPRWAEFSTSLIDTLGPTSIRTNYTLR